METADGIHKDILDKQEVETDGKYREETLKDKPTSSNNRKESQQTLFHKNKKKTKITVHTIEEAMTTKKERTPVSVSRSYDNA